MPKPYSDDLRERVIAAVEEDAVSCREAARRYRVSAASAVKWLQRYRPARAAGARLRWAATAGRCSSRGGTGSWR